MEQVDLCADFRRDASGIPVLVQDRKSRARQYFRAGYGRAEVFRGDCRRV